MVGMFPLSPLVLSAMIRISTLRVYHRMGSHFKEELLRVLRKATRQTSEVFFHTLSCCACCGSTIGVSPARSRSIAPCGRGRPLCANERSPGATDEPSGQKDDGCPRESHDSAGDGASADLLAKEPMLQGNQ